MNCNNCKLYYTCTITVIKIEKEPCEMYIIKSTKYRRPILLLENLFACTYNFANLISLL